MDEKEERLNQKLRYDMRLRVSRTDHAFGPGVAELMEHVEATGSLSKGCKCMGMAYSKGWKILKRAEEDLGIVLVEGNRGGSNGGQTVLTTEGKAFLERYRKFEKEVQSSAEQAFRKWFDEDFFIRTR
ncbi:winged helix-turn-helix domain-containing protein [Fusicatenibacter sp.]